MKNSKQVSEYLDGVLRQISFKEAHAEIQQELNDHIDDVKNQMTGFGIEEQQIEREALRRMGTPDEIGRSLNEVHQPRVDFTLLALMGMLLLVGAYTMFRADHIGLHALWLSLGLFPMATCIWLRPDKLQRLSGFIYLSTFSALVFALIFGPRFDGQAYLALGPLRIKMMDLSCVLFVISLAGLLPDFTKSSSPRKIWMSLALLAPLTLAVGTDAVFAAIAFFIAGLAMILAAKIPNKFVFAYSAVGTLLISSALKQNQFVSSENFARLLEEEKHTDFVFSFLASASPALGSMVAVLSLCLIIHLVLTSFAIKNLYSRTLTTGATSLLALGLVWGLFAGLGFIPMPVTGINFPFLSYGGSLLVAHMSLVGLVIGAKRRKNISVYEIA